MLLRGRNEIAAERDAAPVPTEVLGDSYRFVNQHLEVFQQVTLEGRAIGTVFGPRTRGRELEEPTEGSGRFSRRA